MKLGKLYNDVVVVPFPFSDLSQTKRRPALVVAELRGDDLILCQITSQAFTDGYAIAIDNNDFESGSLRKYSQMSENIKLFFAANGDLCGGRNHCGN